MSKGLTIVVGSLSLSIPRFAGNREPRTRIDGPGLEYSLNGNPINTGIFYEPKHLYEFEFRGLTAEKRIIERQYAFWLRSPKPRPLIVIHDYVKPIVENSQTRALASGATLNSIAAPSGWVEYFARFSVQYLAEPTYTKDGGYWLIGLRLQELEKIAP